MGKYIRKATESTCLYCGQVFACKSAKAKYCCRKHAQNYRYHSTVKIKKYFELKGA